MDRPVRDVRLRCHHVERSSLSVSPTISSSTRPCRQTPATWTPRRAVRSVTPPRLYVTTSHLTPSTTRCLRTLRRCCRSTFRSTSPGRSAETCPRVLCSLVYKYLTSKYQYQYQYQYTRLKYQYQYQYQYTRLKYQYWYKYQWSKYQSTTHSLTHVGLPL